MNKSRRTLPPSIKNNEIGWLLKGIWHRTHSYNKMFSAVAVAEPGSGKSWLELSLAEILDRNSDDVDRFNVDRVYFSAAEFAQGMAQKWPKGTCHVFDDAGLNLFSREAMQRNVRDIAKIFQSVRYKNYNIFLSLPALTMLDKVVRQLVTAYIEPIGIDYELSRSECKFHWTQVNPKTGDIYYHCPETIVKVKHPILDCTVSKRKSIRSVWIDRPSVKLAKQYEKRKQEYMDEFYRKVSKGIIERATPKKDRDKIYNEVLEKVRLNVVDYRNDGYVEFVVADHRKIYSSFKECSMNLAQEIARQVNLENGIKSKGQKYILFRKSN